MCRDCRSSERVKIKDIHFSSWFGKSKVFFFSNTAKRFSPLRTILERCNAYVANARTVERRDACTCNQPWYQWPDWSGNPGVARPMRDESSLAAWCASKLDSLCSWARLIYMHRIEFRREGHTLILHFWFSPKSIHTKALLHYVPTDRSGATSQHRSRMQNI